MDDRGQQIDQQQKKNCHKLQGDSKVTRLTKGRPTHNEYRPNGARPLSIAKITRSIGDHLEIKIISLLTRRRRCSSLEMEISQQNSLLCPFKAAPLNSAKCLSDNNSNGTR